MPKKLITTTLKAIRKAGPCGYSRANAYNNMVASALMVRSRSLSVTAIRTLQRCMYVVRLTTAISLTIALPAMKHCLRQILALKSL